MESPLNEFRVLRLRIWIPPHLTRHICLVHRLYWEPKVVFDESGLIYCDACIVQIFIFCVKRENCDIFSVLHFASLTGLIKNKHTRTCTHRNEQIKNEAKTLHFIFKIEILDWLFLLLIFIRFWTNSKIYRSNKWSTSNSACTRTYVISSKLWNEIEDRHREKIVSNRRKSN